MIMWLSDMKIIAHIKTPFREKFGIPRQSGLLDTEGQIIFEKEYRVREAFRGLEDYSHIWILWNFSEHNENEWSPTVRPPLLGGNKRMGVFATRSPFRPNPIGLSCVKLEKIEYTRDFGPVLHISGADLMDGTPIYDIKPYLAYADSFPNAICGFTKNLSERKIDVRVETDLSDKIPQKTKEEIIKVLSHNPTPSYKGEGKTYKMKYADYDISFEIRESILYITDIKNKRAASPISRPN